MEQLILTATPAEMEILGVLLFYHTWLKRGCGLNYEAAFGAIREVLEL